MNKMTDKRNHIVIMAGGIGSRFWPMSTTECPKQFIDVLGVGRSLLQLTYDRFQGICLPENIWIVTNKKYLELCREQLPDVPTENILLEPCRRNTAPCIAYVSWRIKSKNPKANVVVTPSDHIVTDTVEFQRVITSCLKFTGETDAIVTLGMKPNRPETGYGYIQADLSVSSPRNKEIFRVDSFREKPDIETAKKYIQQNNFFWNAGVFIWSVSTIVNAFRVYQPAISKVFEGMEHIYGTPEEQENIDKCYPECENISVDYAIMEKAEKIRRYNTVEDACTIDEFKMSSALYKVGKAAGGFSGNAEKLTEKKPVPPVGSNPGVGYGFYRFIAVKPKKLVIASDGAWGKEGNSASHVEADNDKVICHSSQTLQVQSHNIFCTFFIGRLHDQFQ